MNHGRLMSTSFDDGRFILLMRTITFALVVLVVANQGRANFMNVTLTRSASVAGDASSPDGTIFQNYSDSQSSTTMGQFSGNVAGAASATFFVPGLSSPVTAYAKSTATQNSLVTPTEISLSGSVHAESAGAFAVPTGSADAYIKSAFSMSFTLAEVTPIAFSGSWESFDSPAWPNFLTHEFTFSSPQHGTIISGSAPGFGPTYINATLLPGDYTLGLTMEGTAGGGDPLGDEMGGIYNISVSTVSVPDDLPTGSFLGISLLILAILRRRVRG